MKRWEVNIVIILVIIIILQACSSSRQATKIPTTIDKADRNIKLTNQNFQTDISLIFSGCGGYSLQHEGTSILVDPFISNVQTLLSSYFKKLSHDSIQINKYVKRIKSMDPSNDGDIDGIFVAHSHYDHLYDVPYFYDQGHLSDDGKVYGHSSSLNLMKAMLDTIPFKSITALKTDNTPSIESWEKINNFKVLPLKSNHAPHFLIFKILPWWNVKKPRSKTIKRICQMPEGENFNFLIEIKEGENKFNIFSNAGSASNGNKYLPSEKLIKDHPIDLLILCAANFGNARKYPKKIIHRTKPKFIMVSHWENFFKPHCEVSKTPMTVPATNIKRFIKKLNKINGDMGKDEFEILMPMPLVGYKFN
ncbi:MAG: MBL fold metallo-hydrolase [Cyclobacteriaceae bacterium]